MIRILIADDHPVVRQGLKAMLQAVPHMSVVGEARDAREAIELARTLEWDVALVDYSMPGQSGIELVKRIKHYHPERAVLVLSMHAEDVHAIQLIKVGASGYVHKEASGEELILAIAKVARGGKYVSAAIGEKLADGLADGADRPAHELLSHREYRVLQLLASGKQVQEIGRELFLSASTISTYRLRLLKKLNLSSNADLVRYAVENGLVDDAP